MYCRKCGNKFNDNELVCSKCGTSVINNTPINNQINYNTIYAESVERENNNKELTEAFIKRNIKGFNNDEVSFFTFIFNIIYISYRKMYSLSLRLFLINFIVYLIMPSNYSKIFLLYFINLYIAIKFKYKYKNYVKNKIDKIREKNPNANQNELKKICSKKGGTSIIGTMVIIIICFLITFGYSKVKIIVIDYFEKLDSKYTRYVRLHYDIPDNLGFEIEQIRDTYTFTKEKSTCKLSFEKESSEGGKTPKDVLQRYTYFSSTSSEIILDTINYSDWYSLSTKYSFMDKYYYSAQYNDDIYLVSFSSISEDESCLKLKDDIVNSFKFKRKRIWEKDS